MSEGKWKDVFISDSDFASLTDGIKERGRELEDMAHGVGYDYEGKYYLPCCMEVLDHEKWECTRPESSRKDVEAHDARLDELSKQL